MFLNILKILASDVLKMFLNIIVSTCIGCVVVILHSFKPATSSILNWSLYATLAAGGYSHILAIHVCAVGKGMVFKPLTLG